MNPKKLPFLKTTLKHLALAIAVAAGLTAGSAQAQLTYSLTGNGANGLVEWGGEADGYKFTTGASVITVSWLGFYDAPNGESGSVGDDLLASHRVSIWRESDQALMARTTVQPGDTLEGSFRGRSVAPVILDPFTAYIIAADYGGEGDRLQSGNDLTGWVQNGITINEGRYGGAGGGMATVGWNVMIGPNFGYELAALSVTLNSPANNEAFVSGTPISATASVIFGTAPYTVKFFTRSLPGGTFAQAGAADTTSPYTVDLGALAVGTYEIYTTVTDSATPAPATATSATHTFTVVPWHTITASVSGTGGSISPSGAVVVAEGASQTFTITPNAHYAIADVVVDGLSQPAAVSSGSYTFSANNADHTIVASFSPLPTHTITASVSGTGGSISPSGAVVVDDGASQTFTITANPGGYAIAEVLVDGVSQPAAINSGSYTFSANDANHTITASFSFNITPPDLTAPGAIAAIKAKTNVPKYDNAYNLGSTGLRGWVHQNWTDTWVGKITDASRQILVTVASTPGSAVVAVDDVILGAVAASSGTVPSFTSDARKAFGAAITNAEKTGAGTLRVKRWRAGVTTEVNIPITTLGTYSATAPYSCPKSSAILANARDQMVGKLLADANYLGSGHSGAINALALLASVEPGQPNYAAVQTHLQTYARSITTPIGNDRTWASAYELIFLSEYYLLTNDSLVVPVINSSTVRLAKGQGMFGTFGHGLGSPHPDGSGRKIIAWYGPVNCAGNAANIAIVLGKKALQAASQPIDPAIDAAIVRSSGFMGSHINKGAMQYGEHFPNAGSYASNSKDATAALFFGLQNDKTVQTEYFARMSISAWIGGELGHTGQGWGSLWNALGGGMGGEAAASGHFKQLLWRYDIHRRTDGSFTYDTNQGSNDYFGGKTADGTYLGETLDYGVRGTSLYLLTYSLPLKRLYITGKNLNTAYNHDLDATKVAHAVSAASYALDRTSQSTAQLFTALGDYDPHVRHFASLELASRSLTGTDLTNLRNLLNDANPNLRGSAAQALGYLQDSTALPALVARLSDADHWVRQKAANAIRYYADSAAVSAYRDVMLEAFIANGPADPDTIDWSDPLQFSNGQLGQLLFGSSWDQDAIFPRYSIPASTVNAPKATHLYPALRIALQLPSGLNRNSASNFVKNYLSPADAQALFPELVEVQSYAAPGDNMFGGGPRSTAMDFLAASKVKEGIPLALSMLVEGYSSLSNSATGDANSALSALASYGDMARFTLPTLRGYLATWNPQSAQYSTLLSTIATIENAITAPPTIPGLCVANSQAVATTGAKAITLTGASPRGAFSFLNVTQPANGTLTGTAPNLTYTPNAGYSGMDKFTFRTKDSLTTSDPATVSIIVGSAAGTGIVGAYFNNADFTSQVLTRTDPQINFDWGTGSPAGSIGADTFSVRWDGLLRVPETGTYTFSTLNSDGARLYINGQMVIDDFVDQTTNWTDSTPINLTAGQLVDLQMFHYENTGSAVAKLKWTGPSIAGASGDIIGSPWLYDGSGTTLTPYAHAQTVTLLKDTSTPVTLTGSGGTLTYAIVTPPAQGALSGTAPNLTYTPPVGFSGSVSFTFRVNNGTSDSAPATVSINVQSGNLSSFTWASAVSGNWSDGTKWTPSLPATAGLAHYALNFTNSGTYTATHNLSNGFQLNQLNTAANVTLDGTNSISFVANGGTLPQINQNGPNAVTVGLPLTLQAMTRVGGSGTGTVNLTGTISGSGGIIKDNYGPLLIDQNNTYTGGTIINAGELRMEWDRNSALGTGTIALNGGTLSASRITAANPIIANGGKIYSASGWGSRWNGPITLNGDLTLITPYSDSITLNGNISGAGGLIVVAVSGAQSVFGVSNGVYLTGTNTYTGKTTVRNYITLICNQAAALGSGALEISNFARVNLAFTGTKTVASLALDGTLMPPGTYGSSTSPATNKNNTYFYGTGTVTVTNNPPVASPQSVSTAEDTQKAITLTGTDAENSALTYQIVSQPAYGMLSGTAPNVTYIPAADYHGADSFTFRVNDGTTNSNVATVSITVTPVDNDPPMFAANPIIFGGAFEETAYTGQTLTGWASDPDAGGTITYSKVSGPAWLAIASDGTLSGTPEFGASGLVSFVVLATDNTSLTATTTLQITIAPLPSLPPVTAGLALHLDATDPGTMTLSGSTVTEWRDKAGSAAKMTLATGTPTVVASGIGGLPTVHFTNGSSMRDGVNHPAPVTIFYVSRQTGGTNRRVLSGGNNWLLGYWGGGRNRAYFEGWVSNPTQASDTAPHLYAATIPGSGQNSTVWAEGIQLASNQGGTQGPNGLFLGGGGAYSEYSDCDISEVLVYHRVLTPAEAGLVGSYLSGKYGLTTSYDQPPVIFTRNPADNATGVAVGADLVATFSENIVKGTGNITVKNLTDGTQTTIAVTDTQVTVSGATLTINPTANLLGGKNYAIRIAATAIDDTVGNSFAGISDDTTWNLTTVASDTTAPSPDPMSFATAPNPLGQTSITMTAATATDPSGVEYYFECTTAGGHSSVWQDSPTYTDTGLTAATQYSYKVRARDKSAAQTATAWSAEASATTLNTPYGTWSDGTWNVDANGLWSLNTNWASSIIADDLTSTANFTNNITADRTVSLDSDRTINRVNFSDSDNLSAGSWILDNNGSATNNLILSGTTGAASGTVPVIDVGALGTNKTATISAIIEGSYGFTKTGTGQLTLSAANTYTGVTNINAGKVVLSNTSTSNKFTIASGTTLELATTSTVSNSVNTEFAGAGTLVKSGTDTFRWSGGVVTYNMSSGSLIDVQGGTFIVASGGNEVWTNNKADLNVATGAIFDGVEATSTSAGGIFVDALTGGGTIKVGYAAGFANKITFGVDNGTGTFSGVLADFAAGWGNYTKAGTGTQTLTGANTYTGATDIQNGAVQLTGSLNTATTLNLGAGTTSGKLILGDATAAKSQTVAGLTTTGTGTANAIVGGGNAAVSTLTVNLATGTETFGGTIGGAGSNENNIALTKSGAGTLILSGTNTYTGATTINGGTLTLNPGAGQSSSTGAFSVNNGAVLLASGTLSVTSSNSLRVGGANVPTFTLDGGTLITSNVPMIGSDFGGRGTFTLTSGTWTNTGGFISIQYGVTGNGSVMNVNGGLVDSPSIQLGQNPGTSTLNLNGGIVVVNNLFNTGSTSVLNFNGGTLRAKATSTNFMAFSGASSAVNVLAGGAIIDTNSFNSTITVPLLSGTANDGGLTKQGAGTLTLTANNTYTGDTTVSAGTLAVDGDSIADTNKLVINGGTVNLTNAETVNTLFFGAAQQPSGTYSTSSVPVGATITTASFTGSGTLIVTSGPPGFASWQTANSTAGGLDADHDNDGVSNGIEYFIYGPVANSGFTALPGVTNTAGILSVTWTHAAGYTGTYGSGFVVETSSTLTGAWTTEIANPNPGFTVTFPSATEVKYTFPAGTRNFARLKVTGP